jgi:hypothetical protein
MIKIFYCFSISAILIALTLRVDAQDAVKIKRVTEPVVFDGNPDEQAWTTLEKFPLVMHRPNFNSNPSEESDVRIGYDNEFLWVGAKLLMKDASRIFAVTKKRDEMLFD